MNPAPNGSPPLVLTDGTIRDLLDTAPYALVIVNHRGRIALVNAQTEALFGYRRDEMVGQPMELLLPPRFREAHVGKRDAYMSDPRLRPMGAGLELMAARKDGTEFPVEVSLSPLRLDSGLVVSAGLLDLTERKRAEDERRLTRYRHDHVGFVFQFYSAGRAGRPHGPLPVATVRRGAAAGGLGEGDSVAVHPSDRVQDGRAVRRR